VARVGREASALPLAIEHCVWIQHGEVWYNFSADAQSHGALTLQSGMRRASSSLNSRSTYLRRRCGGRVRPRKRQQELGCQGKLRGMRTLQCAHAHAKTPPHHTPSAK
jgi:hypothetical protein